MTGSVLVVGSVNIDLVVKAARQPAAGETIAGDEFAIGLGGKGANQAVAAAKAGARVALIGAVGDDAFADIALSGLLAAGVDTDAVARLEGASGIAHIRVAGGDNSIVVVQNANAGVRAEAAIEAVGSSDAGVLLTQLEIDPIVVEAALSTAKSLGIVTILDPAPAAELPDSIWQHVDIVKPNEHEASFITGEPVEDAAGAERAASWFIERGVAAVIITLGSDGAVIVTAHGTTTLPGHAVEAVDSTAAGDTFSGALAAALAKRVSSRDSASTEPAATWHAALDVAASRAMAAAAISVTRFGAAASIPSKDEVDAFLADRDTQRAEPPAG